MRQSSSQVIPPIAAAALIHPVLQAALENLDVQLEEELTRYRRQQRLQPEALRRRSGFVSASSLQSKGVELPQFPLPTLAETVAETLAENPPATSQIAPPAPLVTETAAEEHHDIVAPPAPAAAQPEAPVQPETPVQSADAGQSAADAAQLAVLSASETDGLQPPSEPTVSEDYFASSEELLRSIAEEEPHQRAESQPDRLLDTLLTPLGIGSLLLLLLSSATLGYLVMNPASLGFLAAQKSPERSPNAASVQPAVSPEPIAAPSPNLAAKEFVDLNLNTLSTLPKPSPSPAAPSKPASSPSPQAAKPLDPIVPPAANLSPLPSVTVPAQPAVIAPAPAANSRPVESRRSASSQSDSRPAVSTPEEFTPEASTPEAPVPRTDREPAPRAENPAPAVAANPASPARSNLYQVVTPYSSDAELNRVQQTVPDAYVKNSSNGATVQMGAFSDEAKARELVQELQQQGIEAEVREP